MPRLASLWCVELRTNAGWRRFRVYDDYHEAECFVAFWLRKGGRKIYFWEL